METTPEAATRVAPERPGLRARLAARLPEIVIEALFVLVAVVLAFLVEEWREERELDRIAQEARAAILQEIEHNLDELLESRPDTTETLATLQRALAEPPAGEVATFPETVVKFELALLSSAAWRSAQSMEAARRMDYAWMLQVARAHELQTLYEQAQWAAVDANMAFRAARDLEGRRATARALLARMELLAGYSRALEGDYVDLIALEARAAK